MQGCLESESLTGKKQMHDKALVDTNILFYIIDKADKTKNQKAQAWLASVTGKEPIFVSMQNLREFSNIALRKTSLPPEEINALVEMFSTGFCLIAETKEDIGCANYLTAENNRNRFFDALLVATMQRHGIRHILTENTKHFEKFKATNPLK